MALKPDKALQIFHDTCKMITESPAAWQDFLDLASRLYRYPIWDQVLIYGQRPDATAVTTLDLWNKKMLRWVKKGASGIALIDDTQPGERLKLKYVFDLSDTIPVQKGVGDLRLWKLQPEDQGFLEEYLKKTYPVTPTAEGLPGVFFALADMLTEDHVTGQLKILESSKEDSRLDGLETQELENIYTKLVRNSILYILLQRTGLDARAYLLDEDFQDIREFNTVETLQVAGYAVNQSCESVLRDIGRYVFWGLGIDKTAQKQYNQDIKEKEGKEHGDQLQEARGLSPAGSGGREPDGEDREIRGNAQAVSPGTPGVSLRRTDHDNETGRASDRDRPEGKGQDESPGGGAHGKRSPAGQKDRQRGMDKAHEQTGGTGGEDHAAGDYMQLNLFQPGNAKESMTKATGTIPAAFLLLEECIDWLLRSGSGHKNSVSRTTAQLICEVPEDKLTDLLKNEYGVGGKGYRISGKRISYYYDAEGICIKEGDSARADPECFLSWEDAAKRVKKLFTQGKYTSMAVAIRAIGDESDEVASQMAHLLKDTRSIECPYREAETAIREILSDNDFCSGNEWFQKFWELSEEMRHHPEEYPGYLLRNLNHLTERIGILQHRKTFFPQKFEESIPFPDFITQDEIDLVLQNGTGVVDGKFRVADYFSQERADADAAAFLRKEYGTGGRAPGIPGCDESCIQHDSKGLRIQKGSTLESQLSITLSWAETAKRMQELIRRDDYLTPEETERFQAWKEQQKKIPEKDKSPRI